jgi:beta-phosphoglucomutase
MDEKQLRQEKNVVKCAIFCQSLKTMKKIDVQGKIILFDFDGTLVVTEFLAKQVIEEYLLHKNVPNQAFFSDLIVGRTWGAATELLIQAAKEQGHELDPVEILLLEMQKRYREKFEQGVQLVPGLIEKLQIIRQKSKFMGIVTGSDRPDVEVILAKFELAPYFDRIWAQGEYEKSKPDPSPYLQAMHDLGCAAKDVLVFEDSKAGMESAFRAGIPWVHVGFEAHAREEDPRSLFIIHDWHEIEIA